MRKEEMFVELVESEKVQEFIKKSQGKGKSFVITYADMDEMSGNGVLVGESKGILATIGTLMEMLEEEAGMDFEKQIVALISGHGMNSSPKNIMDKFGYDLESREVEENGYN